jgi:hypothetical protein
VRDLIKPQIHLTQTQFLKLFYLPIYFGLCNLNSCWIKNQSCLIHWSQTRTGLSHPLNGTERLFMEQFLQTPRPQSRQWCRVTRGPNWTSQQQQCVTSWSGTQYDGRALSLINPGITSMLIWPLHIRTKCKLKFTYEFCMYCVQCSSLPTILLTTTKCSQKTLHILLSKTFIIIYNCLLL